MSQLVFKFPFKTKYYDNDFYVSSNNFSAYKLIENWPSWPGKWLNIFGVPGSGKTHLSKILEKKINKVAIIEEKKISENLLKFIFISPSHNNLWFTSLELFNEKKSRILEF